MLKLRAIARWLDERKWVSSLLFPLIAGLPPSLVGFGHAYPDIKLWMDKHPAWEATAVFWPMFLIPVSMAWKDLKEPVSVSVEKLSMFLRILEHIVGKKVALFHACRERHFQKRSIDKGKVFEEISNPEEQIDEIVRGIWTYFDSIKGKNSIEIKVALVRMGREHITSFENYWPPHKSPRCDIKLLQRPDSCFSRTKSIGKIVVVDSTPIEIEKPENIRRFVPLLGEIEDEEKSAICFPITEPHGGKNVNYILSICASKPMHFKNQEIGAYEIILDHFAQRILLEMFLKDIKVKSR